MNEIKIRLINAWPGMEKNRAPDEKIITCALGASGESLIPYFNTPVDITDSLAAMKVNNEIFSLTTSLEYNAAVEPVLLGTQEGSFIYRRSLAYILAVAARELFPDRRLYIGHSLGNSYYYTFETGNNLTANEIKLLSDRMKSIVEKDIRISCHYMAYDEAIELFEKNQQPDTALLLSGRNNSKVLINECAGFRDLYIAPLVHRTGLLTAFELMPYQEGFLLRYPVTKDGKKITAFKDSPKLFEVYHEYKNWGRIVGVQAAGRLNKMVFNKSIREYIHVAEAFHEKKLAELADRIYDKKDSVRAVFIAGPSSSGKTTTAKRLSIALRVMGIEPIAISLDSYYVGTDKTPLDENGKPDYECLEALDIPYLNKQLLSLLNGEEISLPVYDFKTGLRSNEGGQKIKMGPQSMLIIEGIHGLNDALTPQIKKETKFKLYVSALTQLNLDDHNRISTSDNRLLRRMVRDNKFRNASAERTCQMWPGVQRGEKIHIFPFQNDADAVFNSALDYELAVLKFFAEPLLRSVKPREKEYSEAVRLLAFLENFIPIQPQYVPGKSILREFIGDSEFKY